MALIQLPHLPNSVSNVPIPGGGGVTTGQVAGAVGGVLGSKPGRKVTGEVNDDLARDDKTKNPDLRDFLKGTGWPSKEIENAAAVVWGESRGICDAVNHNANGTDDKGLFQINDVHVPKLISDKDRLDCNKNSKAALKLWKSEGWQPWYSSGCTSEPATCRDKAPADAKITGSGNVKDSLTGSVSDAASAAASPFTALTKLVAQLFNADTWFRVGKVVLGGVVLIMAVEVFLNKSGAGSMIPKVMPIPI